MSVRSRFLNLSRGKPPPRPACDMGRNRLPAPEFSRQPCERRAEESLAGAAKMVQERDVQLKEALSRLTAADAGRAAAAKEAADARAELTSLRAASIAELARVRATMAKDAAAAQTAAGQQHTLLQAKVPPVLTHTQPASRCSLSS
jgi:hypothetical protein